MNSYFFMKSAAKLLIALGSGLILVNALGFLPGIGVVEKATKHQSGQIAGYDYPYRNSSVLQEMLDEPMADFDIDRVNTTIFESIFHSDKRTIHFFENWLMWLGGIFYEPLTRTQSPGRIVTGRGALCSEVSILFNRIANTNGFETRFVELNGHVVSEIRQENGWRIVDPDYGVSYPVGLEELEKKEGIAFMKEALETKGYDPEKIARYIHIFQSSNDNEVTEPDTPLSPRLHLFELVSEYLKWIIPLILLALGMFFYRHAARIKDQADLERVVSVYAQNP